jgi:hypothetical protein
MSSEARGKACDLKMFLSQGKRPVTQQPLPGILPVASGLYAVLNSSHIW